MLVYGHAELDLDDVVAKRIWVFERYMPIENVRRLATGLANEYAAVMIRVRPDRTTSWDYTEQGFIQSASRSLD